MLLSQRVPNELEMSLDKAQKKLKDSEALAKYKTELCKNWMNGYCVYNDKCIFAHGEEELRGRMGSRTIKCKNFEKGVCFYGERCLFKHSYEEDTSKKRRLPIFTSLYFKAHLSN